MPPVGTGPPNTFTPSAGPGTNPSDQASGTPKALGTFVSTAYGPPWNTMNGTGVTANGTDLRPNKKVYGVAVDPKVIPLGTYLHLWPNPFDWEGTFIAFDTGGAIKGKRIDFYDWRGRSTQMRWGRKNTNVHVATRADAKLADPKTGGGLFPNVSIPNPLNAVDDAASAIKGFIQFLLSPKSIGDLLAKVFAWWLRLVIKAIWQYVIAPFVHWQQRAVMRYTSDAVGDGSGVPVFVTLSFWATAYSILWAQIDGDGKSLFAPPHKTPLGSLLRSVGNSNARRKLVKPKDVVKKTATKPTPVASSTGITQTRSMSVSRPRTVRVGKPGAESLAPDAEIKANSEDET